MLERQRLIDDVRRGIAAFQSYVGPTGRLNLLDTNVHAEDFVSKLLNALFGWQLISANRKTANHPCFDLLDDAQGLAVQVTSENTSAKLNNTINCLNRHKRGEQIRSLKVFLLVPKQKRYTVGTECPGIKFDWCEDVLDFGDAVEAASRITDLRHLQRIHECIVEAIPTIFPEYRIQTLPLKTPVTDPDAELDRLAVAIEDYYKALRNRAERTKWQRPGGVRVHASEIQIPARVLKEKARPERERPLIQEGADESCRPHIDPKIAALYEMPGDKKEEVPWEQERQNLRRAVILGPPGGGKTFLTQTTILALVGQGLQELTNRKMTLDKLPVPVWIELNTLAASHIGNETLETMLSSLVRRLYGGGPALGEWLRQWLPESNCWLVLDGLDQVESQHFPRLKNQLELIQRWKCHVVLTCRKANYDPAYLDCWDGVTLYELAPFGSTEISDFISRWHSMDERGKKLESVVARNFSLQQTFRTPLMATLACLANESDLLRQDTRRVDLYGWILRDFLRKAWREDARPSETPNVDYQLTILRGVAWSLFVASPSSNQFRYAEVTQAIRQAVGAETSLNKSAELLDEFVDRGILAVDGLRNHETVYSFPHRSLQEYLVARYIAEEVATTGWERALGLLDKKAWTAEWQEVIVFLAGILDHPAPLLEMLRDEKTDDVFRHRLALAVRCIGELSLSVDCKTLIDDVTLLAWERYWEYAATELVVAGLGNAISTVASSEGMFLPLIQPADYLAELVDHPYWPDKTAIRALGRLGTAAARRDVIDRLIECFPSDAVDPDDDSPSYTMPEEARLAVQSLGTIAAASGGHVVVDRLMHCLEYSESWRARHAAAEALGGIGIARSNPKVVDRLVDLLQDEAAGESASIALVQFGATAARPDVVDRLLEWLPDDDISIRERASRVLKGMGAAAIHCPEVLDRLVEGIRQPTSELSSSYIDVVIGMGPAAARHDMVTALLERLHDVSTWYPDDHTKYRGHRDARNWAAAALGNMSTQATRPEVVDALIVCLEDDNPVLRYEAIDALGMIGLRAALLRPDLVDRLLERLTDPLEIFAGDTGNAAARALESMLPALIRSDVVDRLEDCLQHSDSLVRSRAIDLLERIGPTALRSSVVLRLRDYLQDRTPIVQFNAARVLGRMGPTGCPEVIDSLADLLSSQDRFGFLHRELAARALGEIGTKAATPKVLDQLVKSLQDSDWHVRFDAAEALGKMVPMAVRTDAITGLFRHLDEDPATHTLGRFMDSGARFFSSPEGFRIGWVGELSVHENHK
jgi:HEAT repeat protein